MVGVSAYGGSLKNLKDLKGLRTTREECVSYVNDNVVWKQRALSGERWCLGAGNQ